MSRAFPNSYAAEWNTDLEAASLDYCKTAKTVTAGRALQRARRLGRVRNPTNDVDPFVCDDARMADAQHTVPGVVKDPSLAAKTRAAGGIRWRLSAIRAHGKFRVMLQEAGLDANEVEHYVGVRQRNLVAHCPLAGDR